MYVATRAMGQELFQPPNVKGWAGGRTWITSSSLYHRYNFSQQLLAGVSARKAGKEFKRLEMGLAMLRAEKVTSLPSLNPKKKKNPLVMMAEMLKNDKMKPLKEVFAKLKAPPKYLKAQAAYDPVADMKRLKLTSMNQIIDRYLRQLLITPITEKQKEALLDALTPEGKAFNLDAKDAKLRLIGLIHLITTLPEYQMN
jgi:hypothetical protein